MAGGSIGAASALPCSRQTGATTGWRLSRRWQVCSWPGVSSRRGTGLSDAMGSLLLKQRSSRPSSTRCWCITRRQATSTSGCSQRSARRAGRSETPIDSQPLPSQGERCRTATGHALSASCIVAMHDRCRNFTLSSRAQLVSVLRSRGTPSPLKWWTPTPWNYSSRPGGIAPTHRPAGRPCQGRRARILTIMPHSGGKAHRGSCLRPGAPRGLAGPLAASLRNV